MASSLEGGICGYHSQKALENELKQGERQALLAGVSGMGRSTGCVSA